MSETPTPRVEIALLGPGLLGASLALALKNRARVRLWGRRNEVIAEARHLQTADLCTTHLQEAVEGADWVIFCTPVEVMESIARQILPWVGAETVVTDVGSVKKIVVDTLEPIFGPERFLGSHPMAGSEQSGLQAARADLFAGAVSIVTPSSQTPVALEKKVADFWLALGCEVHRLSPEEHDRRVALISHLPHLLAGCLVNTVVGAEPGAMALAGQGFRDTTRIASGPPEMWQGILGANRREIIEALGLLQTEIDQARDFLQRQDDAGLRNFLADAKIGRDGIVRKARYGGN